MQKDLSYACNVCNSISIVSGKYLFMDYVKLSCCSVHCKKIYIFKNILEKHKTLPTEINKIIIEL